MEGQDSKKAQVIKAEMDTELQDEAIHTAAEACDRYDELSEIIEFVKKEFDKKHGQCWHCFAGTSFCSYFTCEENCFINFSYDGREFLLFKTPTGSN
ncbi:Dynein light chain [Clonorchis sinensis]|uniref:Dynein light chain n=2 Tax=Clonorchis sinensis TaxID=79923 RepID=A0A8T1N0Z7_CLOSI|nr:Dynein light chain [Clonorchis sinensis]GAA51262.1 dynein light chain LC8-type [Clonorchis sinensis]